MLERSNDRRQIEQDRRFRSLLDIARGEPTRGKVHAAPDSRSALGAKLPSRSRGASIATFPCSVINVFGDVPLRVFPAPPSGS